MGIEASIVVSFGDGNDSAFSVIELDNSSNTPNGKNWNAAKEEVNAVLVGGDVYFIVQLDSGYEIGEYRTSSGTLVSQGTVYRTMESQMVFLDGATENEFPYIPKDTDTPNVVKEYIVSGSTAPLVWSADRRTANAPSTSIPLIVDVEASCAFTLFKLSCPTVSISADDTWPIACLIVVNPI